MDPSTFSRSQRRKETETERRTVRALLLAVCFASCCAPAKAHSKILNRMTGAKTIDAENSTFDRSLQKKINLERFNDNPEIPKTWEGEFNPRFKGAVEARSYHQDPCKVFITHRGTSKLQGDERAGLIVAEYSPCKDQALPHGISLENKPLLLTRAEFRIDSPCEGQDMATFRAKATNSKSYEEDYDFFIMTEHGRIPSNCKDITSVSAEPILHIFKKPWTRTGKVRRTVFESGNSPDHIRIDMTKVPITKVFGGGKQIKKIHGFLHAKIYSEGLQTPMIYNVPSIEFQQVKVHKRYWVIASSGFASCMDGWIFAIDITMFLLTDYAFRFPEQHVKVYAMNTPNVMIPEGVEIVKETRKEKAKRVFCYTGGVWSDALSIIDITRPDEMEMVKTIPNMGGQLVPAMYHDQPFIKLPNGTIDYPRAKNYEWMKHILVLADWGPLLGVGSKSGGVVMLDVSNPSHPVEILRHKTTETHRANRIRIYGDYILYPLEWNESQGAVGGIRVKYPYKGNTKEVKDFIIPGTEVEGTTTYTITVSPAGILYVFYTDGRMKTFVMHDKMVTSKNKKGYRETEQERSYRAWEKKREMKDLKNTDVANQQKSHEWNENLTWKNMTGA